MIAQRRPIMVDSVMAALHFQRTYRVTIKPATIRQWAARKAVKNYGGRMRYNLRELEEHARAKGLIA